MKSYRSCLFTVLLLAIVAQLRLAKLDENVRGIIQKNLDEYEMPNSESMQYFNILDNCDLFETKYKVTDFVDTGMNGLIVDVVKSDTNQNFVAKIIFDRNNDYNVCNDELILEDLNKMKISYVNTLIESKDNSKDTNETKIIHCVLILEKADTDLYNADFFPEGDEVDAASKIENSKNLFRFFGRVIQSFAELHFRANVLHGDIKPDNIMVNKKQIGNGKVDLIPVIIDFGLRLENKTKKDKSDNQLRYAPDYRPPEMTGGKRIQSEEEEAFAKTWENNWKNYRYSKDFVEDVYALGKTIADTFEYIERKIDPTQCEIKELRAISKIMMQPKEQVDRSNPQVSSALRPNMKAVLKDFITRMEKCDPSKADALNQQFISEASASLKELDSLIRII